MAATSPLQPVAGTALPAWDGFQAGLWQHEVNVRDFIQQNYDPYYGDGAFLAPATARTQALWGKLTELFVEERRKGVLDVSQIPSSITEGKVIAVGKGKVSKDGKNIPMDVKKGDTILFAKYSGTEVKIDGDEHLMMREDEVLAVIEK